MTLLKNRDSMLEASPFGFGSVFINHSMIKYCYKSDSDSFMKILVIGGVAGGATAAARLRRNDESAQIVLIERGPCISFANRGLLYHISGIIVLLSPGGEAIRPKLPGIDSKRVFVLRNIPGPGPHRGAPADDQPLPGGGDRRGLHRH